MPSKRLIQNVLLVTLTGLLTPVLTMAEQRLGEAVQPHFQAVELRIDPAQTDYTGSVRVELRARTETNTFRFHARDIAFDTFELSGPGGAVDATYAPGEDGTIEVTTTSALRPGTDYVLSISFTDDFNTDAVSMYRMEYEGTGYIFSQFQSIDARKAFPCWDEPGFKLPYQLTIAVPEGQMAVTNTPAESEEVVDGWVVTRFKRTQPLPSYLLAVAAGPLEAVPVPGMGVPTRIVTVSGQSQLTATAAEMAPPIMKALESYFGSSYPFAKLDLIAVPEFWPGAMENPGAITFADRLILFPPGAATTGQKRNYARVLAHEIAHMWFGDLVTMAWWDDLWLNESFADWMGDKIAAQVYPELKQDLTNAQQAQNIMVSDATPSSKPIRNPGATSHDAFNDVGLAYSKGKTVLAMFEEWIGPETFRQGVVNYINANAWGNATADDLWKQLDEASGKDLSRAMATFIGQPGFPLVTMETLPGGKVRLTQKRFSNSGVDLEPQTWSIPIALKYASDSGVDTRTILLEESSTVIELDTDGEVAWVFPNAGGNGYYRWSAPPAQLADLARNGADRLSARERITFVGNSASLLSAGVLSGDDYLELLRAAGSDPEPMVVQSVMTGLDGIELAFVGEEEEEAFAYYVNATLVPALDRYGVLARDGEAEDVSMARPTLIGWLGIQGMNLEVRSFANEQAVAYMNDSESIDPSIAEVALRIHALDGDETLFETYRERFETAQNPTDRARYLAGLGAFEEPALQERALAYTLEGPVRPNELFTIVRGIADNPTGRQRAYDWMTGEYDRILEKIPKLFGAYLPFMANGCSAERMAAAQVFFAEPEHNVPGTEAQMAKVSDSVTDCVSLRDREGEAVAAYFRRLGSQTEEE